MLILRFFLGSSNNKKSNGQYPLDIQNMKYCSLFIISIKKMSFIQRYTQNTTSFVKFMKLIQLNECNSTKTPQFMNCIVAIRCDRLLLNLKKSQKKIEFSKISSLKGFFCFLPFKFHLFFLFRLNTCYLVAKCTCAD